MRPGLTCQSTRTHNSRRRLRRKCWWSGHFYVMPLSRWPLLAPCLVLCIALTVLSHAFFSPFQLRLVDRTANGWVFAGMVFSAGGSILWIALATSHRIAKILLYFSLVPAGILYLIALAFALSDGAAGTWDLISEKSLGQAQFRLYRHDCGGTCNYGLVLRREYDIPLGLYISTYLWERPDAAEGTIEVHNDEVRVVGVERYKRK